MSVRKINESTLTGIADAIRSKTGGSALINPEDMASEIESIPSGSVDIWEDEDFGAFDMRGLSSKYMASLSGYYTQVTQRQASEYKDCNSNKIYRVVPSVRGATVVAWGIKQSGKDKMLEHTDLSGGTSVIPSTETVDYTDSSWQSAEILFAAQYGIAQFGFMQNYGGYGTPLFSVKSAPLASVATQICPDGYEIDTIVLPSQLVRGTSNANYPYYASSTSRDMFPELLEFQSGKEYKIINPNGYNLALWTLTAAGETAYEQQASISGKYADSGWKGNGYTFTPTRDSKALIQLNNTPLCAACFIMVCKKSEE